ncbi:MAG: MarR family transcriptional regulator [Deltaproteobacteria bacterium]|nr:MarR family transcriptional regulator [Deltaproteobacteria bacterium]MBW1815682.1 MarR family transcriptional regulator [Deltaproteobacteria bacterium]MBW2285129.1 MarR family transcriptional regulator [Deltaproteobacteria bacterium]
MAFSSGDISAMVFKRVIRNDLGKITIDSRVLGVLVELDGKKSAGEIAKRVGIDDAGLQAIIRYLLEQGLIEPVEGAVPLLTRDFFHYLNAELSMAVGPLAEILIEDAVEDMGFTLTGFPRHRAAELIDSLARQVPREEKRIEFQQAMLRRIHEGKL